eukprot:756349-Hanusia_phi.AAC.1
MHFMLNEAYVAGHKTFDELWSTEFAAVLVSNNKILRVNKEWKQHFLFEEKEILNRSLKIMEGPLTQKSNILELQEASKAGMNMRRTVTLYCRDGSPQVTVVDVKPVTSDKRFDGNSLSVWQMRTSFTVMEKSFCFSHDIAQVMTEVNSPFRIVKANRIWCETCEFTHDEIIGKTLEIIQGPSTSMKALSSLSASISQGIGCSCTLVNYTKSKMPILNQLKIFPMLCDKSGYPTHFVGNMEISINPDFQEIEMTPYPFSVVDANYPHTVVITNSFWQQCDVLNGVKQVCLRKLEAQDSNCEGQRSIETVFVTEDLKRFATRARIVDLKRYGSDFVTHHILVFENWKEDKQKTICPSISPCEDQVIIQKDGSVRLVINRDVAEQSNIETSLLDELLSYELVVTWNLLESELHIVVPPNILKDTVSSDLCNEMARDLGRWYSWWFRVLWLHSRRKNDEVVTAEGMESSGSRVDDQEELPTEVRFETAHSLHIDLHSKRFWHSKAWGNFWKDSYFFKQQVRMQMSSPALEGHEEILEDLQRQDYVHSWEHEDQTLIICVNAAKVLHDCHDVSWISQWKIGLDRWEGWWLHFLWLHYKQEDLRELTAMCLQSLDELQLTNAIQGKHELVYDGAAQDVYGTFVEVKTYPVGHGALRFLHEEILKEINAMGYPMEWRFSDDDSKLSIRASLGIFYQAECAWAATWANDSSSGNCWLDRIKFIVGSQNHLTRKYAALDESDAMSDATNEFRTYIVPRGIFSKEKREFGFCRLFERGLILNWSWETEETIRIVVHEESLKLQLDASMWCDKWVSKSYREDSWVPVWLRLLWLMNTDEQFASATS